MIKQKTCALEKLNMFKLLDMLVPLALLFNIDFSLGDELVFWNTELRHLAMKLSSLMRTNNSGSTS